MGSVEAIEGLDEVFRLLHPVLQKALVERGFLKATEPQKQAIPRILEGRNVLIIAPTGSGKTEAAVLPVLSMLKWGIERGDYSERGIYVLYITPLRALNRDLLDRLTWWCEKAGVKIDVRHGDTDVSDRVRQSRDPPHVLITTPEMLQAILTGRRLREHLKKLRWVIVDEVHELAEDKRGSQLALTLERIKWLINRRPQIIGLSATVGSPEEVAKFLVGIDAPCDIVQVSITREMRLDVIHPRPSEEDRELAEKLQLHPDVVARLRAIRDLIERHGSTIIFVNTRSMAELLMYRFTMLGMDSIGIHHSSLSKASRIATERAFKKGMLKAIIATSSLELGIDIGHVNFVIQYISPHQVTRLVQRVGRSGHRLDKVPEGVIITEDLNDTLEAIALVQRARMGILEPTKIPEKPYDVLFNQIAAMLIVRNRISLKELYEIFHRAYPYRTLTMEELRWIAKFMSDVLTPRIAYYVEEDDVLLKPASERGRRELYRYFFDNLSMIPEERQYLVVNQANNEPIGFLDEAFIAEYGEPGVKFVFRGGVWVLTKIEGDVVYVMPARDVIGAIPSWIGEEIPVPYEVAQDVGRLKREIAEELKHAEVEEVARKFSARLEISYDTVKYAVERIAEHIQCGMPVPSDRRVLIERVGDLIVIHTHCGTLANRTLARAFAEYLSSKLGLPVGTQQDAYAVIIQLPRGEIPTSIVLNAILELASMNEEEFAQIVIRAITKSGLFKRKFVHIARRFNVVKKDKGISEVSLSTLIDLYRDTPVYAETLKELLTRDFDLDTAYVFLKSILNGERELVVVERDEFSPMSREIVDRVSRRLELIAPERKDRLILESLKARLLNDSSTLVCLSCGWISVIRNKDLPEDIKCPICGNRRIGVLKVEEEKARQLTEKARKGKARAEEEPLVKRLLESAELVSHYGRKAVLALSSRISNFDRIREILEKAEGLDELVELIHEAEKEELRSRFLE